MWAQALGKFLITFKHSPKLKRHLSIWLLDLARTLPSTAQLDGFDIDIYDCPPKEWLPKNVSMQFLDALGEIPNHLNGIYDIIQLRLFHTVVRDNDPVPLLRNVMKMLSGFYDF